jgi:hypothetical protein
MHPDEQQTSHSPPVEGRRECAGVVSSSRRIKPPGEVRGRAWKPAPTPFYDSLFASNYMEIAGQARNDV